MAAKSEALLRAAARIAADEIGGAAAKRRQGRTVGVIHLTIRGRNANSATNGRTFLVDVLPGKVTEISISRDNGEDKQEIAGVVSRARLHLIYASEDVFLDLARKHIDPRMAVLAGKLFFSGEMALGVKLGDWLKMAVERGAEGGMLERAKTQVVEIERWENDEGIDSRQRGLKRRQETLEVSTPPVGPLGRKVLPRQEAGVTRHLRSRVLDLEEEVENLDKRTFTTRAWILRQLVLMLYRLLSLVLLAIFLLGAHLAARFLSKQAGSNLSKVPIGVAAPLITFSGDHGAQTEVNVAPCVDGTCMDRAPNNRRSYPGRGRLSKEWKRVSRRREKPPSDIPSREYRASMWVYWTLMILVVVLLREHQRRTGGLILRRIKTFCLAGTAILVLKMTQRFTKGMSPDDADKAWADTHKLLAPYMYGSILDIAGMWVKTGQYLSSRADVMPQPYIEELSRLQDAVPASSYDEIDKTVQEQIGLPLTELFATVEREALASASVAQVHRCTLKDGREAVVKVQHRNARQLFLEDLRNISRLVRIVAWAEKDYDFRPIMDEWTSALYAELDFVHEATNLLRIAAAMKRSGLDVIVPELIPEFTRMKVVVMTFCEGFKVTDSKALEAAELDREQVMRVITESFAYQIHVNGLFNGDPHPGNILLQPATSCCASGGSSGERGRMASPVLLDWGLAKTLPENLRIAFSRFVYAACERDFVSMLVAFEEMGVKLNRFDPAEDMHNIRFLLRDTQPAWEAKEDSARFRKRIAKKRSKSLKNPVEAYPGDLLFFFRVHSLLRGLAARLNVRQKYMDIMAPYALQALREVVPEEERATRVIYPSPLLSTVDSKVRAALEGLVERGKIRGCQVCVIYRGNTLVDLSAGTQGPVDPRPVRPCTLFCVFSAGKAVCATAVHLLADRGLLHYDQLLGEIWPEFARRGKEATTVRHVLTHTTGLQHVFPDEATFNRVCDWEEIKKLLEEAEPAWTPGSRASYHYFTFGWLVAAMVEKVSGVPFGKFVREEIATPLGLEDSFFMGDLSTHCVETSRIAHIEHSFKKPGSSGTEFGQNGRFQSAPPGASTQATGTDTSTGDGHWRGVSRRKLSAVAGGSRSSTGLGHNAADDGEAAGNDGVGEDIDDQGAPLLDRFAAMASTLRDTDPEEGAAVEKLARKLAGREYFLDPRVFNYPQMKDACIPAANGHFTAKALATLYDNFLVSLGIHSGGHASNANRRRRHGTRRAEGGGGGAPSHPSPLLRRAKVNEMRSYQVKEASSLHALFGLPRRGVRYSLGYQMFGFWEKPPQQQQQRHQQLQLRAAPLESGSGSISGEATASVTAVSDTSETAGTSLLASSSIGGGFPSQVRGGGCVSETGVGVMMSLAAASSPRGRSLTDSTSFGGGTKFFRTTSSSFLAGEAAAAAQAGARAADRVGGGGGGGRKMPPADSPSRGRVRLSGFGHMGLGGSLALCDPASGLVFAMVTNKVGTGRDSSSAILSIVCEELGIGDPSHFFED